VTSAVEVAAAARAVGVLLGVVGDGAVGGADVAMVVVAAHGGVWAVYRDPFSVLGWVAARVAAGPSGRGELTVIEVLEESAGWLGAADLELEGGIRAVDVRVLPIDDGSVRWRYCTCVLAIPCGKRRYRLYIILAINRGPATAGDCGFHCGQVGIRWQEDSDGLIWN